MNRLGLINALLGMVFGLLLWTAPPVQAYCVPNIRATTPTGDFTLDDSNGTATDLKTGLTWMRCALGQNWDVARKTCVGNPAGYAWGDALRAARDYTFAGHSDWRVPNVKELRSIVEERCLLPSINEIVFPMSSSWWSLPPTYYWYWSSSTWVHNNPGIAWSVSFSGGHVGIGNGVDITAWKDSVFFQVRLVRGGPSFSDYGAGGGSGVSVTPEQPVPPPPPPSVTVPSGNHKYLVLLIHGYNSDPSVWAESMKTEIVNQLGRSSGDACLNPIPKGNISWQICTLDWSQLAGDLSLLKGPWFAYDNARIVGQSLAKTMVDKQLNYDFIHFIAHSAGSQVADTAATWLPRFINDHNAQSGDHLIKPTIHTTFLDAYDPSTTLLDGSLYGMSSDWAEQYVDMRRVVVPVLDDTNLTLIGSYNVDITALDPNSNDVPGTEAHAWPYKWYQETVKDPASSAFGFSLSRESGGQFPSNLPRGGKCVFTPNGICSDSGVVAAIATVKVVIDNMADPIASALASATGYIVFLSDQLIKITTGSPAWVSLPINVPEPIDVLTFDYTYQRQAEGLLSVFFDDQLVYRSDQRFEPASLNHSDNVPIGAIASGAHKLSFRLDAFNNTQSEIDISRIQLGKIEVSEQVDTTPPVITPTVTGTLGNNGWYTSDITVSWEVTDAESDITFTDGCQTTAVTTDTLGVTFTCSATSGGGPASQSVTIKRDATPPTITGSASPAANANDWRKSAVTVSFTCDDALSGIATCTAPQTLNEGANQTASGTATDKAGNTATTQVMGINVDMTPPVIAGMPTACTLWPPNHKMVQVATVTATDALSGVAPGSFSVTGTSNEPSNSADPDIVIKPNGSDGFTVQLRADRLGTGTGRIYTITATATDRGGNTATSTATCTVPHDQGQGN